eukprot:CCRYP_009672-RA/>CCRYP_009672-RA protein AED:0.19 eAED:0.19 QI:0/-1/0/1/-1/1/1/0/270
MNSKPSARSMEMRQFQETYLAVMADTSQIRDGRDVDKLRSNLESRSVDPDEEILNLCTHKVHGGDNDLESQALICSSHYCHVTSRAKAVMQDSLCSIRREEEYYANTNSNEQKDDQFIHNKRQHDVPLQKAKPIRMSRRHSNIDADSDMSSSLSSKRKSNVKLRRKSEPLHRDYSINQHLSSIMRQPKYSWGFGGNGAPQLPDPPAKSLDYSKLLDVSSHRFKLTQLKPNQLETASSKRTNRTATSEKEDWLPKGVDFDTSMEVYVFETR